MDSVSLQIRFSTFFEDFTLSALPSTCNLGFGQLRLIYDAPPTTEIGQEMILPIMWRDLY